MGRYCGILLLILWNTYFTSGQSIPIDTLTGKITYTDIISVDSSFTKDDLYYIATECFKTTFVYSPIQVEFRDEEQGLISCKSVMKVYYKSHGNDIPGGYINFKLIIFIKDGVYRYIITDFIHNGVMGGFGRVPTFGDCEIMMNIKPDFEYYKLYNYYLYQLDNSVKGVIDNLKVQMVNRKFLRNRNKWKF